MRSRSRIAKCSLKALNARRARSSRAEPRLLAITITQQHGVAVGETTVYRLLKAKGLVRQRPLDQRSAAKDVEEADEGGRRDLPVGRDNFFVPEFGDSKGIPVIDGHLRKLLACPVRRDESGQSVSDAVEMVLERRAKIKLETMARRHAYNSARTPESHKNFRQRKFLKSLKTYNGYDKNGGMNGEIKCGFPNIFRNVELGARRQPR